MSKVPGIGTEISSTPRKILLNPNAAQFLPGGKIIAGAQSRDPGNAANVDVLRAGIVMGKRSNDGKYAPSILGLLTTALVAGGGTVNVSALVGDEIARRIVAGGVFKVVGCPAAAVDEVQTFTTNSVATGSGTFTIGFAGDMTAPIQWNASDTEINTAIALMEHITTGDIVMTAGDEPDTATEIVMTILSTVKAKLGLGPKDPMPMLTWDIAALSGLTTIEGVRTTTAEPVNEVKESRALSFSSETAGAVTLAANSAVAEIQTSTIDAVMTGGTYTLTYKGQTTAAIEWDASSAEMQTALELLSTVNPGDIVVQASNEPDTSTTQTYTFLGTLGDVSMLSMDISNATSTSTISWVETAKGELAAFATVIASFAIGSLVMPMDGSEVPLSLLIEETGIKMTDVDGNNVDLEYPKVLLAGQIFTPGIVDYPQDGPTQVWLKEQLGTKFLFDDNF